MVKKKKQDFNFEQEKKLSETTCAKNLKPGIWILGGVMALVVLWTFVTQGVPSAGEIQEAWGEPEKTYKLFTKPAAAQQALTPLPSGARWRITPPHNERGPCHNCHPFSSTQSGSPRRIGQPVAWTMGPRGYYNCPSCGWRGRNLAMGSGGILYCPRCRWSPVR